jgi:hypothetical protein
MMMMMMMMVIIIIIIIITLSGNIAISLHFSEGAVPGQVPYWYEF